MQAGPKDSRGIATVEFFDGPHDPLTLFGPLNVLDVRALDEVLSILRRVLLAFDAAEMESDQEQVLLHRLLPPNFHDTILTIAMSILDQACEQCSRRFRSCSWMPASIPPSPQPAAGMRSLPDAGRSRPELVPDRP